MATPTRHDASRILLGSAQSSYRTVSVFPGDPASFPAGFAISRNSDGSLSRDFVYSYLGVSLGASLSDTGKVAICREGNAVPIRLAKHCVLPGGNVVVVAVSETPVKVAIEFEVGAEEPSVTVTTEGDGTKLITVLCDEGVTSANDFANAFGQYESANYALGFALDTSAMETAFTPQSVDDYATPELGSRLTVIEPIGCVSPFESPFSNVVAETKGVVVSGRLTGITESGSEVPVVLVDMVGGL